ncbi:MAG: hypothetical protein LBQ58_04450 [Synergistaceae bacterium]|jgi:hypothetical protein|nr:hypothetical protein [Synergistaceae bacterium]
MADIKRYCSQCFKPIPPDWNQHSCPVCGGRIKFRLIKKRAPKTSQNTAEKQKNADAKIRVTRRLSNHNSLSIFTSVSRSILGPRFMYMHPLLLFALNILTVGARSIFWVLYNMPSFNLMAKHEEKITKGAIYLWLTSYCISLSFVIATGGEFFLSDFDVGLINSSILLRLSIFSMSISIMANKYLQYWMREVIVDSLQLHEVETIRNRAASFAPSPMLIWFLGFPYIQLHINRMIKNKGLLSYTWSKNQHNIADTKGIIK